VGCGGVVLFTVERAVVFLNALHLINLAQYTWTVLVFVGGDLGSSLSLTRSSDYVFE
jgi:hypothetical protein